MAKTRMINTRYWNDNFVSQLDPIEKLLFIYFLTNEHTNICGIYELPLKVAAVETGIDPTMFEKILPRLKDKILYIEGWVCVKNFPKYQSQNNLKVKIGIENEMRAIPSDIIKKAIAYGYPIHVPSHLDSDSDSDSEKTGATAPSFQEESEETTRVAIDEDGNEIPKNKWGKKPKPQTPLRGSVVAVAKRFGDLCTKTLGTTPTGGEGVYKHIERVFTVHKLTEEDAYDVIDEWFTLGKPDLVTIDVMNCFARKNINEWRQRNGK